MPQPARDLLGSGAAAVLAFFSPRSARLFARGSRGRRGGTSSRATAVSLSPATDAALGALRFGARRIAAAPSRDGMLAALGDV